MTDQPGEKNSPKIEKQAEEILRCTCPEDYESLGNHKSYCATRLRPAVLALLERREQEHAAEVARILETTRMKIGARLYEREPYSGAWDESFNVVGEVIRSLIRGRAGERNTTFEEFICNWHKKHGRNPNLDDTWNAATVQRDEFWQSWFCKAHLPFKMHLTGTCFVCNASKAIREAQKARDEEVSKLVEALQDIRALIEDHTLVRSVTNDDAPGWAIRQLPLIRALAKMNAALAPFLDAPLPPAVPEPKGNV